MPISKTTIVAQLNDKELELLQKAQAILMTENKPASVRAVLMLGVYSKTGLDISTNT